MRNDKLKRETETVCSWVVLGQSYVLAALLILLHVYAQMRSEAAINNNRIDRLAAQVNNLKQQLRNFQDDVAGKRVVSHETRSNVVLSLSKKASDSTFALLSRAEQHTRLQNELHHLLTAKHSKTLEPLSPAPEVANLSSLPPDLAVLDWWADKHGIGRMCGLNPKTLDRLDQQTKERIEKTTRPVRLQ